MIDDIRNDDRGMMMIIIILQMIYKILSRRRYILHAPITKELIQRGMAVVDWAPDYFDPLMVEPVNSSNPSILRGSRQEEPPATRF